MRGGNAQRTQYVGSQRPSGISAAPNLRRPTSRRIGADRRPAAYREKRKSQGTGVYQRRRMLAISVIVLTALALVLVAFTQVSGARDRSLPIDLNNAGPDTVLAEVVGDSAPVNISSPIRPESITGLAYHPEGESLVEMSPQGRNLSGNPVLGLFASGSTPEKIQYYVMDPAARQGPHTGALDVGAEAETAVYAPVTGTVTAIRPEPVLQKDASVVEIKPDDNPEIRVTISLVQNIDSGIGPKSPVTAGITQLGSVADSSKVLKPQIASYTFDAGNHVTVSASEVN